MCSQSGNNDDETTRKRHYGAPQNPLPQSRRQKEKSIQPPLELSTYLSLLSPHSLINSFTPSTMTSIAEGLFKSLPKPKYTGEDEEIPHHAQPRGPRVVGADQIDESQIVLRVSSSRFTQMSYLYVTGMLMINALENRSSPVWKPYRMASSSPRRFRRRWRVPRDFGRTVSARHGPERLIIDI